MKPLPVYASKKHTNFFPLNAVSEVPNLFFSYFFLNIRMCFMLETCVKLLNVKSLLTVSTWYPLKEGQFESFQKRSYYLSPTVVVICRVSTL